MAYSTPSLRWSQGKQRPWPWYLESSLPLDPCYLGDNKNSQVEYEAALSSQRFPLLEDGTIRCSEERKLSQLKLGSRRRRKTGTRGPGERAESDEGEGGATRRGRTYNRGPEQHARTWAEITSWTGGEKDCSPREWCLGSSGSFGMMQRAPRYAAYCYYRITKYYRSIPFLAYFITLDFFSLCC